MLSGNPCVSVIIPVYNTEKYLVQTLDSIRNQTLKDIEVILVDDGSTDGSPEIISRFCALDSRFKSYREDNSGQGAARNEGLRHASGHYVYYMDSDDLLVVDALEKALIRCQRDDLDVVLFDADVFYDEGAGGSYRYDRKGIIDEDRLWSGPELLDYELDHASFIVSPCLMLIKRTVLDEFPGFPTRVIHEDNVLAMYVMLHAKTAAYMSDKLFLRRVRGGSTMSTRFGMRNIEGYIRACTDIAAWKSALDVDGRNLVEKFLYKTLDSVVWLAGSMHFKDRISAAKALRIAGLSKYASLRNRIRLAVGRLPKAF